MKIADFSVWGHYYSQRKSEKISAYGKDRDAVVVDGIIFATGYKNFGSLENQEPCLPLLEGITSDLTFREDGGPEVLRDYRLSGSDLPVPIYLNGLCEASHGFGDAGSFSILSIRGAVIASSLEKRILEQRKLQESA